MKKRFAVLFFTFIAAGLFAQNLSVETICAGLSKNPNTTGDFVQIKTINASGRQLKSSGNFIISNEGIMWKTLKPFPSSLIITKDAMIQIGANGQKSVMNGSDNAMFQNIADTLSSVFAGNSVQLENNFSVEVNQEKDDWIITLTPKDSVIGAVMNKLLLSGSQNNSIIVLESLELIENSSNKIRYEFQNQKYPKELTEDEKANFKAD